MARGSTRAWRAVRAAVLARDRVEGWACRAHDEGWCDAESAPVHVCQAVMTHVHHTRGVAVTGNDPRYLVGACQRCNLAIGKPGGRGDPPNVGVTSWG